jgi:rhomboid protease GluP
MTRLASSREAINRRNSVQGVKQIFGKSANPRPRLCPSCGTLVGANSTKCFQCGANVNFSFAAANKALAGIMPGASAVTYGILGVTCVIYALSFLWTLRQGGGQLSTGGTFGFDIGEINGRVLQILGASLPLGFNLAQPWRFVTAIFLHGSFLHIAFNMWGLMILGPMVEELYGSARYLFVYVITGAVGFVLSSATGHFSIGASGSLLGLMGVSLAVAMSRRDAASRMIQGQMLSWLILTVIFAFFSPDIDNFAHFGGFVTGFALGKIMADRLPATPSERNLASILGWASALIVIASLAMIVKGFF